MPRLRIHRRATSPGEACSLRAERVHGEGRTARRRVAPSTGRGWASSLSPSSDPSLPWGTAESSLTPSLGALGHAGTGLTRSLGAPGHAGAGLTRSLGAPGARRVRVQGLVLLKNEWKPRRVRSSPRCSSGPSTTERGAPGEAGSVGHEPELSSVPGKK